MGLTLLPGLAFEPVPIPAAQSGSDLAGRRKEVRGRGFGIGRRLLPDGPHDHRVHGRSEQVDSGHDIDHYAADAFAVAEALDLRNAIHIGHSTGGGEVARYVARHGEPAAWVAKAVLPYWHQRPGDRDKSTRRCDTLPAIAF